jgi:hypothetical protein
MREMKEDAYRSELGEHSDRQDGNDRQQGAKLRALPLALNENPHGALHRGRVSGRSLESRCPSQICRVRHRNSRRDVRSFHKGGINVGGLSRLDENFNFLFRLYIVVSWSIWFLYGLWRHLVGRR